MKYISSSSMCSGTGVWSSCIVTQDDSCCYKPSAPSSLTLRGMTHIHVLQSLLPTVAEMAGGRPVVNLLQLFLCVFFLSTSSNITAWSRCGHRYCRIYSRACFTDPAIASKPNASMHSLSLSNFPSSLSNAAAHQKSLADFKAEKSSKQHRKMLCDMCFLMSCDKTLLKSLLKALGCLFTVPLANLTPFSLLHAGC